MPAVRESTALRLKSAQPVDKLTFFSRLRYSRRLARAWWASRRRGFEVVSSIDRAKITEVAQKYLAKGQYDKAIAEYQRLVQHDPNDMRTLIKIADLYARKGSTREAIDTYARVAALYTKQGYDRQTLAIYKTILGLDPASTVHAMNLAKANARLGLTRDALTTYEGIAQQMESRGQLEDAASVYQSMIALDSTYVPALVLYAEVLNKLGRSGEAIAYLQQAADGLYHTGRLDEYVRVAERILFHRADDFLALRGLAKAYLLRGDAKRALGKLQQCYKQNRSDLVTLELLAETFLFLGQNAKALSVYDEVLRLLREQRNPSEELRIIERMLQLDPSNQELTRRLGELQPVPEPVGGEEPLAQVESIPPEMLDDLEELEDLDEQEDLKDYRSHTGSAVDEPDEEEFATDDKTAFSPPQQFAERDFEEPNTGSIPNVVATVPLPEHAPSFGQAPASSGSVGLTGLTGLAVPAAQIERLLAECDVYMRYGLKTKVLEQLQKILESDPYHIQARERFANVLLELGHSIEAIREMFILADVCSREQPQLVPNILQQILQIDPENQRAQELLDTYQSAPTTTHDSSHGKNYPAHKTDVSSPPAYHSLEDLLDDFELYLSQGFFQRALDAVSAGLRTWPDHPLLQDKLFEVQEALGSTGPLEPRDPSGAPASPHDRERNASALSRPALAHEEQHRLSSLVAELRLGVEAEVQAQAQKEGQDAEQERDGDSDFDLGIAYLEMGLLDEAIAAFRKSMVLPRKACAAHTMVGACYRAKKQPFEAIGEFKKGLLVAHKEPHEETALYYELGQVYQELNDLKEAIFYFEKAQRRDPNYRDLPTRIPALRRQLETQSDATDDF